jgi:hypothetical protein
LELSEALAGLHDEQHLRIAGEVTEDRLQLLDHRDPEHRGVDV